jgi:hypothetical protein
MFEIVAHKCSNGQFRAGPSLICSRERGSVGIGDNYTLQELIIKLNTANAIVNAPVSPRVIDGKDIIDEALDMLIGYGGFDGGHHKMWVIDQAVRILAGDDYERIIYDACHEKDGTQVYDWDCGIAP